MTAPITGAGPSSAVLTLCPWCDKFTGHPVDHGPGKCRPAPARRMPLADYVLPKGGGK